jgi:Ion channel
MRRLRRGSGPPENGHYEVVLALLVAGYLASALASSTWVSVLTLLLYVGALVLAIRAARLGGTQVWALRIALTVGSVATLAVLVAGAGDEVRGTASLWLALVLGATVILVVRHILRHPVVTLQTIAGALSAYLLIGLMFAEIYTSMARLGASPFFAGGQVPDPATIQYFSFTTLTTLGYGDFTAAHNAGRAIAVLEALLGQIFLVTLVARLVSNFGSVTAREATREDDTDRVDGE